jgi:hypothetical protein
MGTKNALAGVSATATGTALAASARNSDKAAQVEEDRMLSDVIAGRDHRRVVSSGQVPSSHTYLQPSGAAGLSDSSLLSGRPQLDYPSNERRRLSQPSVGDSGARRAIAQNVRSVSSRAAMSSLSEGSSAVPFDEEYLSPRRIFGVSTAEAAPASPVIERPAQSIPASQQRAFAQFAGPTVATAVNQPHLRASSQHRTRLLALRHTLDSLFALATEMQVRTSASHRPRCIV